MGSNGRCSPFFQSSQYISVVFGNYWPLTKWSLAAGVNQRFRLMTSILLQAASLQLFPEGALRWGLGYAGHG